MRALLLSLARVSQGAEGAGARALPPLVQERLVSALCDSTFFGEPAKKRDYVRKWVGRQVAAVQQQMAAMVEDAADT